jgi:hypothetical protein
MTKKPYALIMHNVEFIWFLTYLNVLTMHRSLNYLYVKLNPGRFHVVLTPWYPAQFYIVAIRKILLLTSTSPILLQVSLSVI